jgi:TatD DNase family protein
LIFSHGQTRIGDQHQTANAIVVESSPVADSSQNVSWVDTHAHLTHAKFAGKADEFIRNALDAHVVKVISAATCAEDARAVVELARQSPVVRAAVGVHPNDTHLMQPGDWASITDLAADPNVVAIGETGLDRYWKDAPLEVQQESFRKHLRLAEDQGLPVVIHCREAMEAIIDLLRYWDRPVRGTLHCFIGTLDDAKRLMDLGLHLGIGGISTFANKDFDALRETIRQLPAERLLVETDAPFLSPHPHRGKTNEPARVAVVGEALAAVRGWSVEQCAAVTSATAEDLFRRI